MARIRPGRALAPLLLPLIVLAAACAPTASTVDTTDVFSAAPWEDGETLTYELHNNLDEVIGHGELITTSADGRFRLEQHYTEANPPAGSSPTTDSVVVVVEGDTFRPAGGSRRIVGRDSDGEMIETKYEWQYPQRDDEVFLETLRTENDDVSQDELRVRDHHYDNESALWLWRSIAFEEGFDQHYVSVNPIEATQVTVNLRVPQRETIEVPAGQFEAWRIIVRTGRAVRTAWINVDAPHEVLRWDNGEVVFELVERR